MRALRHLTLALLCLLGASACTLLEERLVSGSLLFEEQFVAEQVGDWFTEQDNIGQSYIEDEQMILAISVPHIAQYTALQTPLVDDFMLEVDVTQQAGTLNSSYGVLFRLDDGFYRFDITGNGLYVVEKRLENQWQRLTDGWVDSPFIVRGLNQTNRLGVSAVGEQLIFFINGQQVAAYRDDSYQRGQIALDAGTFAQGGLVVAFDNLVVRYP